MAVRQVDRAQKSVQAEEHTSGEDYLVEGDVAAVIPKIPGFKRGTEIDRHAERSRRRPDVVIINQASQSDILTGQLVADVSRRLLAAGGRVRLGAVRILPI